MDFAQLADYLERLPEEWGIPQCALVIRQGRDTVFEKLVKARKDAVYWLYSATKLFTATMFCRLLEQGKLRLEDRVSDYLPEYAHLDIPDHDGRRREAEKRPNHAPEDREAGYHPARRLRKRRGVREADRLDAGLPDVRMGER